MNRRKKSQPGILESSGGAGSELLNRNYIPAPELSSHARAFQAAAKKLADALGGDTGPASDLDIFPVVFVYRHAVELQLKGLLLGPGGKLLAARPDSLSISKTHSVSWLGQFVSQIVILVNWEKEFKCEGIENLADFRMALEGLNSVDPGGCACRLPALPASPGLLSGSGRFAVTEFVRRIDALLALLERTAAVLAATWEREQNRLKVGGQKDRGKDLGRMVH